MSVVNSLEGKTILIVDDEEILLEILTMGFEETGAKILTVSSGNEAFKIFLNEHIDIVLTDIQMPNGTGVELVKRIEDSEKVCPNFFLYTGFSKDSELNKLPVLKIFDKPFNLDELVKDVVILSK